MYHIYTIFFCEGTVERWKTVGKALHFHIGIKLPESLGIGNCGPKLRGKSVAVVAEAHPVTSSRRRDSMMPVEFSMRSPSLASYPWTQTFELSVAGCLTVHSVISAICN